MIRRFLCALRRHELCRYYGWSREWACRCGSRTELALDRLFAGSWGDPDA